MSVLGAFGFVTALAAVLVAFKLYEDWFKRRAWAEAHREAEDDMRPHNRRTSK